MKGRTYNASSSLARPELVEIKNTIRNLKKDAEMRLTLDVEAQQSFEFLSEQIHGLRKAFSTLSDVLVEEVDLIRSEAAERTDDVQQKLDAQAKGLKAARTELTLLRSEVQTGRAAMQTKASALEERLDNIQDDLTVLAQEVAKGGSAQHLLQLESVQLRSQLEDDLPSHTAVLRRFGRYPHRNAAKRRETTPAEAAWLAPDECPGWAKSQAKSQAQSQAKSQAQKAPAQAEGASLV